VTSRADFDRIVIQRRRDGKWVAFQGEARGVGDSSVEALLDMLEAQSRAQSAAGWGVECPR
jgi:hypothetical protein